MLATISRAEIKQKEERGVEIMPLLAKGGDGGGEGWSQFRLQGKIVVFLNNSRSSGTWNTVCMFQKKRKIVKQFFIFARGGETKDLKHGWEMH